MIAITVSSSKSRDAPISITITHYTRIFCNINARMTRRATCDSTTFLFRANAHRTFAFFCAFCLYLCALFSISHCRLVVLFVKRCVLVAKLYLTGMDLTGRSNSTALRFRGRKTTYALEIRKEGLLTEKVSVERKLFVSKSILHLSY